MTPRKMLLTLHLAIGLAGAPMLAVLGLTGAILVFEEPLDRLVNARLLDAPGSGPLLSPAALEARLVPNYPNMRVVSLSFAASPDQVWRVKLAPDTGPGRDLLVNPHDGSVLGEGSNLSRLLSQIHQLHTRILAGAPGRAIVGWGGVALLLLASSGLYLWWPGKILRIRPGATSRRFVFELHSALGGVTWLALMLLGATAIGIHWNSQILSLAAGLMGESVPAPFPDVALGCEGAPDLAIDRIITAASYAVPGARVTGAYLDDGHGPARVIMKFPEDHTPSGRTNVFVAPCDGRVIDARSTRTAPVSYRAMAIWNRELHTGDLGGWPTRILAALASLTLPVMALTGPLIWWKRRKRRRPASGGTVLASNRT